MGNCCGRSRRKFPFPSAITKRCNTTSKDTDSDSPSGYVPDQQGGNGNKKEDNTNNNDFRLEVSTSSKSQNNKSSKHNNRAGSQRSQKSNNAKNSSNGTKNGTKNGSKSGSQNQNQLESNQNLAFEDNASENNNQQTNNYLTAEHAEILSQASSGQDHNNNKQIRALSNSPLFSKEGIQHIQDREQPEELDEDLHPSDLSNTRTFFLSKALDDSRKLTTNKGSEKGAKSAHKRFSSTSTIYIDDSTVSQPNQRAMVKCVSLAIYYHIRHRKKQSGPDNHYTQFDEKHHPLTKEAVNEDYFKKEPDHKIIYRFIRQFFTSAQLNAECAIVMLVYLERLMTYGELRLQPSNWKRVVLGAILLASKVWDDQAVWNVDYCQILQELSVDDMNSLERRFLELLQFNINVGSSVYAKYYFDLRHLASHAGLLFNISPLSPKRAKKLEASSRLHEQMTRDDLESKDGETGKPIVVSPILLHKSHSADEGLEKITTWHVHS